MYRDLKKYIKRSSCYPDRCRKSDYENIMQDFKTSEKVKEDNLLNFYLSSVTIKDFKYEPKKDTAKI